SAGSKRARGSHERPAAAQFDAEGNADQGPRADNWTRGRAGNGAGIADFNDVRDGAQHAAGQRARWIAAVMGSVVMWRTSSSRLQSLATRLAARVTLCACRERCTSALSILRNVAVILLV